MQNDSVTENTTITETSTSSEESAPLPSSLNKRTFIQSLPLDLSVAEVVRMGKEKGFEIKENYVAIARGGVKNAGKKKAPKEKAPKAAGAGKAVSSKKATAKAEASEAAPANDKPKTRGITALNAALTKLCFTYGSQAVESALKDLGKKLRSA